MWGKGICLIRIHEVRPDPEVFGLLPKLASVWTGGWARQLVVRHPNRMCQTTLVAGWSDQRFQFFISLNDGLEQLPTQRLTIQISPIDLRYPTGQFFVV
jgi:hypothetical protein